MDAASVDRLLATAEAARPRMHGFDAKAAIAEVEAEYPAMREALDWLLEQDRATEAYRLASALVPFWMATNRIEDGDAWFGPALAAVAAPPARALYDHGYLVFWAGRYELAEERFVAARTAATAAGDATVAALAMAGSARVALNEDPATAVDLLRSALDVTDGTDDVAGRSSVMHVLGVALQMSGDLEGARAVMSERLALGRATRDAFLVWVEAANLSMVERQLGDLEQAAALSREALAIVSAHDDQLAIPWVLNGLAAVTAAAGDHVRAATMLGLAEAMLERAGGAWPPDEREQYEATVAALSDALPPADLAAAREAGAGMGPEAGVAFALDPTARGSAGSSRSGR